MVWVNIEVDKSTDKPDDLAARALLRAELSGSGITDALSQGPTPP
jgi:hypothetical protein